jgi:amino-acid N-acetyltransferase
MLSAEPYEALRTARIDDVGGILELLEPLESAGALVRRSRERLETEIERFSVVERDRMIVACAALYPYPNEAMGELAALAVHPDYRSGGRGDRLLADMEEKARGLGIRRLFVLTTQTAHWFRERGFEAMELQELPMEKQRLYNFRRNSKVFAKEL